MDAVVVEHVFVTTMEGPPAIAAVSALLSRHGFSAAGSGFAVSPDLPTSVEFERRKRRQAFRLSRGVLDAGQRVRVDFDRGRVTVVAALDNLSADIGRAGRGLFAGRSKPIVALQTQWLMAIANAIETRLTNDAYDDRELTLASDAAKAFARKQTRNALIVLAVVFLIIAATITIAVMSSRR